VSVPPVTRICIFGNSHLAALRSAHIATPRAWPSLKMTMIGAHKNGLLETRIDGTVMHPVGKNAKASFERLAGINVLDLAGFDAFVIAGCQIAFNQAANMWVRARWPGLPSMADQGDMIKGGPALVSQQMFRASLRHRLNATLGMRFARHLRAAMPDMPIYLTSQPRVAQSVVTTRATMTASHRRLLRRGDAQVISDLFDDEAALTLAQIGGVFVPQPDATRHRHILTAKPFTEGAKRLSKTDRHAQPPTDVLHANATYGATVLDQLAGIFV